MRKQTCAEAEARFVYLRDTLWTIRLRNKLPSAFSECFQRTAACLYTLGTDMPKLYQHFWQQLTPVSTAPYKGLIEITFAEFSKTCISLMLSLRRSFYKAPNGHVSRKPEKIVSLIFVLNRVIDNFPHAHRHFQ